jgi:hypothetical protein
MNDYVEKTLCCEEALGATNWPPAWADCEKNENCALAHVCWPIIELKSHANNAAYLQRWIIQNWSSFSLESVRNNENQVRQLSRAHQACHLKSN